MISGLTAQQLTGQDESHLVTLSCGHRLQVQVAAAFAALQADALAAGFDLEIASSFRSFGRQRTIWNGKAEGERPVYDDSGNPIVMEQLSDREQMHAIMRFSALPGTSRHHWGSDLDVFDARALPAGASLQLSQAEVETGGIFDPLHCWLDERIADNSSFGLYRPYDCDRGGVAPERWHLSYAPVALPCERAISPGLLLNAIGGQELALEVHVRRQIEAVTAHFAKVSTPPWES